VGRRKTVFEKPNRGDRRRYDERRQILALPPPHPRVRLTIREDGQLGFAIRRENEPFPPLRASL